MGKKPECKGCIFYNPRRKPKKYRCEFPDEGCVLDYLPFELCNEEPKPIKVSQKLRALFRIGKAAEKK